MHYEVGYKCYYHELSEWAREEIEAVSALEALNQFLKDTRLRLRALPASEFASHETSSKKDGRRIRFLPIPSSALTADKILMDDLPEEITWWERNWYHSFRYVKPADSVECPHCGGTGRTPISQPSRASCH